MERISIVIPVFKPNLNYFKELLDSVALQSYSNFEVVISDDADDGNVEIFLKTFRHLPLRYIRNTGNTGIFYNLNNAIKNADGDYIQIFCQDDVMKPDFLQKQYDAIRVDPKCGMVFCTYYSIDENSQYDKIDGRHQKKLWNRLPDVFDVGEAHKYFLKFGCIPHNLSPVMLRKAVFNTLGYFDGKKPYAGDFFFWVRLNSVYSIRFVNYKAVNLRAHSMRASNTLSRLSLINEESSIYSYLLTQLGGSSLVNRLFANVRGAQHLWYLLRYPRTIGLSGFKEGISYLNKHPFSVFYSFFLMVTTVNQRFNWLRR